MVQFAACVAELHLRLIHSSVARKAQRSLGVPPHLTYDIAVYNHRPEIFQSNKSFCNKCWQSRSVRGSGVLRIQLDVGVDGCSVAYCCVLAPAESQNVNCCNCCPGGACTLRSACASLRFQLYELIITLPTTTKFFACWLSSLVDSYRADKIWYQNRKPRAKAGQNKGRNS